MRVLVTGAAGYVGRNLVLRLSERGHQVVAHARRPLPVSFWERPPDGTWFSDLAGEQGIEARLRGLDAVVHCAAALKGNSDTLTRDNVTAASNLARATARAGVARLVHLSSVAVYGSSPPFRVREDGPLSPDTEYGSSKAAGERVVVAAFRTAAVLRPGLVWGGPHDARFMRFVTRAVRSGWMAFPGPCNTPLPFTHIDNLADAAALALESGAHGAFNVTDGAEISFGRFVAVLAGSMGIPAPRLSVPLRPVAAVVSLADGFRRALAPSASLPLTPSALRMMNTPCVYSIQRARTVLGYAPVPREHLASRP